MKSISQQVCSLWRVPWQEYESGETDAEWVLTTAMGRPLLVELVQPKVPNLKLEKARGYRIADVRTCPLLENARVDPLCLLLKTRGALCFFRFPAALWLAGCKNEFYFGCRRCF